MLSRKIAQGRWVGATLVVALALVSLVEIAAPAGVWTGALMVHAGWVLGLLAAVLALLALVTIGLRVESHTSPKIDQWFLLTVLSWLVVMLSHGWAEMAPAALTSACLLHASYQLTVFASAQFLLWSASFETHRLRALVWGHGALALGVMLATCAIGSWIDTTFQAWRVLNVVGSAVWLLLLGRALLSNGEARSWLILGGSLMAFGIQLTSMSAADHGVSGASAVRYMFAAYLLVLWLLVSKRISSRSGISATDAETFESSFFAGETLASSLETAADGAHRQAKLNEPDPDLHDRALRTHRRIAQDRHDGAGSDLVSIDPSLGLSDAQRRAVASALAHCLLDVKIPVDDIEVTHEHVLDAMGRLRYRVQRSLDRLGIDLAWEVDFEGPLLKLNDERSRQALHVAQEALANVMRHSRATRVTVRCHAPPPATAMVLEIHDDGAGFEVPQPGQSGGRGLSGMRHRAVSLGGSLEVLSEPGCGTLVRMTLPL